MASCQVVIAFSFRTGAYDSLYLNGTNFLFISGIRGKWEGERD